VLASKISFQVKLKKKINVEKSTRVKNNAVFLKYSFDNGTSRFATDRKRNIMKKTAPFREMRYIIGYL